MIFRKVIPLLVVFLSSVPLSAVDFIRGDTNGDGVVSISDASHLMANLFFGTSLQCEAAGDFENNERLQLTDAILILRFIAGDGNLPSPPFPIAGPDTTTDPSGYLSPCKSYGGRSPLEDPAAKLKILDTVAVGGEDVHARITLAVSNSVPIGAYSGTVDIGRDLVEDALYRSLDDGSYAIQDLTGVFEAHRSFKTARVEEGKLRFGLLHGIEYPEYPVTVPPAQDVPALVVTVCLRGGTPAGQYPLILEEGELSMGLTSTADPDGSNRVFNDNAGYAIRPALVSGTLTVLTDVVAEGTCDARPLENLNATFKLGDAFAPVGGDVSMPFNISADRECQGFGFQVAFDPEVLEATGIEKRYPEASGKPYPREDFYFAAVSGGWVGASVVFGFQVGDFRLPAHQENEVLRLHFLAKKAVASTEVRFDPVPTGHGSNSNGTNFFKAFGDTYNPVAFADSFVFVNSLVQVLPDNILFLRGDSNGDDKVDISDAQTTLNYLFIGGASPRCWDAADANDDGRVDVSDPIATLQFLFLGRERLPEPFGSLGKDPTVDSLPNSQGCYREI